MDAWSKYQIRGLWGIWADYFVQLDAGFVLGVGYDSTAFTFSTQGKILQSVTVLPKNPVFHWTSPSGLTVNLYAEQQIEASAAEYWSLLLHYESQLVDESPTFVPVLPPSPGLTASLNAIILQPPDLILLNGQPGVGKKAVLQCLALLYAGVVPRYERNAVFNPKTASGPVVIIPEIALLEIDDQQVVLGKIKAGARVWSATVYDTAMLLGRKILLPALAELLEPAKVLLPALAKRGQGELDQMAAFWQAFYGVQPSASHANLDFYKRRSLGVSSLSVESILEEGRGLRGVVAEFEKEAILKAQARVGRSQHKIAGMLKVSRGSLQHKLRKYQLESYASPDADTEDTG